MEDHEFLLTEANVIKIDSSVLNLIPAEFAIKNGILPFKVKDNLLYIATRDNDFKELGSRLKLITKMKISIVEKNIENLDKLISKAYKHLSFLRAIDNLKNELKVDEVKFNIRRSLKIILMPQGKILDYIINTAIEER